MLARSLGAPPGLAFRLGGEVPELAVALHRAARAGNRAEMWHPSKEWTR